MQRERGCLPKQKNLLRVRDAVRGRRVMDLLQVLLFFHAHVSTLYAKKKKKREKSLGVKERTGNKAACIIEQGKKSLPTISQL